MNRRRMAFAGVSVAMCLCTSVALAAVDPAMLKARQKFFGIDNVDVNTGAVKKDKVITSWLTNTTYIVSIMGNVILLDSYISRPELPDHTPRPALRAVPAAGPRRRQTGRDFPWAWPWRPCA